MRKLCALVTNELIKTFRKISIWVILFIMIVLIGFVAVTTKISQYYIEDSSFFTGYYNLQQLRIDKKTAEDRLEKLLNRQNDGENLEKAILEAGYNLGCIEIDLEQALLIEEYEITEYNYKSDILFLIRDLRYSVLEYDTESNPAEKERVDKTVAALTDVLKKNSYAAYIEYQNSEIRAASEYTDEQKEKMIQLNNFMLQADPEGSNSEELNSTLSTYKALLSSIEAGRSMNTNLPMTSEERQKAESDLAVMEYNIKNGYLTQNADNSIYCFQQYVSVGYIFVVILVMILAGSSVSSEMATGSIKSLIISPTKRWKIFTAKLITLSLVALISMMILYIASAVSAIFVSGTDNILPYVFTVGDTVQELNFFIFGILFVLSHLLEVFIYLCFAFMLSVLTRNTAISVSASCVLVFVGELFYMLALSVFGPGSELTRFFPFTHIYGLIDKFFPYLSNYSPYLPLSVYESGVSLTFTLVYLAVMLFLIIYTALDSFCRRDI